MPAIARLFILLLAIPSAHPATPSLSKPALVAARPDGRSTALKPTPAPRTAGPAKAARALQATAGAFVLGLALVALTPTTHIIDALGAEDGMRLLTALSTTSAAAEIGLSPLVGSLSDTFGRKPILLGAVLIAVIANGAVAITPTVGWLATAKFVSPLAVGLYFLASGATLSDCFQAQPAQLAAGIEGRVRRGARD
jgi:MFS family permease